MRAYDMKAIVAIIIVLALASSSSVIAGSTSRLIHNPQMSQRLESGNPPEGLRWYATGREGFPDAVIGLDPDWHQVAKFWREVDSSSEDTGALIQNVMRYREKDPQALDIIGPDSKVIGIYWSSIYWTIVRIGKEEEIRVYRPKLPNLP